MLARLGEQLRDPKADLQSAIGAIGPAAVRETINLLKAALDIYNLNARPRRSRRRRSQEKAALMPRLIRVFPRKTRATPDDALAYFGPPDRLAEADEVHVSVAFTYDRAWAEQPRRTMETCRAGQSRRWSRMAIAARTLCQGATSSRATCSPRAVCPRRCWFCSVWKRDSGPPPLANLDGHNILDDKFAGLPRDHVEAVFAMLRRQNRRVEFTGGLEALALQDYQVELLASLRPRPAMFWAYDPGDEFETLQSAARRLLEAGVHRRLASDAGIRADRISQGHVRGSRAALTADGCARIHADGDAVAPETASQMSLRPDEGWRRTAAALVRGRGISMRGGAAVWTLTG